jgi:hypothetical protein
MFLTRFTQKTAKEDLNIKRDRGIISWLLRKNILEDTKGHHIEAVYETLLGGPDLSHPQAACPATMGNAHELPESSSTVSQVGLIQGLIFNP